MNTLTLRLGSEQAQLEMTGAPPGIGLMTGVNRLMGRRGAPASLPALTPFRVQQLANAASRDDLAKALEQAWQALKNSVNGNQQARQLQVELGAAHSRLGIVQLGEMSTHASAAPARQQMVEAWVEHTWDLPAPTQILRWRTLKHDKSKLLISAVDHFVFSLLEEFAARHRLRFTSCKPAIALAWEQPSGIVTDKPRMLAWLERSAPSNRAPLVQLLRLQGTEPTAIWRGLVGPPEPNTPDIGLSGAFQRFQAHCKAPAEEPRSGCLWPAERQPFQAIPA